MRMTSLLVHCPRMMVPSTTSMFHHLLLVLALRLLHLCLLHHTLGVCQLLESRGRTPILYQH